MAKSDSSLSEKIVHIYCVKVFVLYVLPIKIKLLFKIYPVYI